ncbi:DNA repair protein RecO (recombination protein O) [Deinobacterium chartae]|uniref:DNA repair protein RecO n=1 Tax=Deinobacterium chartae TaxID=521158 RepID=A0A841HX09_9DEIO|nr:DNA repair protein RecO (recombination protein O) [Deinobacterium chartae]
MKQRYANRSGIVLRRFVTPAGDVILSLLTPQGKLKAIARGGAKGIDASKLNLFQHLALQTYTPPGADLSIATQVTLEGALPRLSAPQIYGYAHLLAELAEVMFQEGEAAQQAFELFGSALRGLSHHADPEWVALVMAFKMLGVAGFAPRVRACASCGSEEVRYFDALSGSLRCAACAEGVSLTPAAARFLGSVYRQTVRQQMETPLEASERPAVWRLLESYTRVHVADLRSWRSLPHEHASALQAQR